MREVSLQLSSPAEAWEPKVTAAAQSPCERQGRTEQFAAKHLSVCLAVSETTVFKPQVLSIPMRSS